MIVVGDTTPFNYLVQVELVEIRRDLYGVVYIPQAVLNELLHDATPAKVRAWALSLPDWILVRNGTATLSEELCSLDLGEREAISLALSIHADKILADDQEARVAAERMGLSVSGTLSVVKAAEEADMADFDSVVSALLALGFRASEEVIRKTRPTRS